MPAISPAEVVESLARDLDLDSWPDYEARLYGSSRAGTDPRSTFHGSMYCQNLKVKHAVPYSVAVSENRHRLCYCFSNDRSDARVGDALVRGQVLEVLDGMQKLAATIELAMPVEKQTVTDLQSQVAQLSKHQPVEGRDIATLFTRAFTALTAGFGAQAPSRQDLEGALMDVLCDRKKDGRVELSRASAALAASAPAVPTWLLDSVWQDFRTAFRRGETMQEAHDRALLYLDLSSRRPRSEDLASVVVQPAGRPVTFEDFVAQWRIDADAQLRAQVRRWVELIAADVELVAGLPHVSFAANRTGFSPAGGPYPVRAQDGVAVMTLPLPIALAAEHTSQGVIVGDDVVSEQMIELARSLVRDGERVIIAWWTVLAAAGK